MFSFKVSFHTSTSLSSARREARLLATRAASRKVFYPALVLGNNSVSLPNTNVFSPLTFFFYMTRLSYFCLTFFSFLMFHLKTAAIPDMFFLFFSFFCLYYCASVDIERLPTTPLEIACSPPPPPHRHKHTFWSFPTTGVHHT